MNSSQDHESEINQFRQTAREITEQNCDDQRARFSPTELALMELLDEIAFPGIDELLDRELTFNRESEPA